jgi:hypothetical protein
LCGSRVILICDVAFFHLSGNHHILVCNLDPFKGADIFHFFLGERFERTNLINNLFGDLAKDRRSRVANLVDNLVADLANDRR